jgi:hypothetical protein
MTKKQICKICGKYSGKSDTCKKCKKDFPYQPAGKGSSPFDRKKLFEKQTIKNRKEKRE